ncbi:sugar kinase [Candidatus Aerophobetes bacterium]|nr:sugar kinase [Candidatus Aerophobetes bacterium]
MTELRIRSSQDCKYAAVSLGEVMIRLNPDEGRVRTARTFTASEGGGEYNVTRALKKVFGLNTTVVTALPDSEVGHLCEDLMMQGGIDLSYIVWVPFDGVGRKAHLGLNWTEKGYGVRTARTEYDRGHTPASQLKRGDIDWNKIFKEEGAQWFHTGGIYAALSETTPEVIIEAIEAAKKAGTIISYDLNYRASLWKDIGGQKRAREVNQKIAPLVDVMMGNEEDFSAALGYEVKGVDISRKMDITQTQGFREMAKEVTKKYPNFKAVLTSLRNAKTALINDWGGVVYMGGEFYEATPRRDLEVYDRVGMGDSFASGFIYAILSGKPPQEAVEFAAAHGALAGTTPGDTSMATLAEVIREIERAQKGGVARAAR